jgi:hypothetical protein
MSSSGGSSASEFSRELSAVTVPWGDVPRPLAAALEPCRLFSVEGKGLCLVFLVLGLTVVGCFRFDITTTQYEGGSGKERRLRYYPRCGVYLFFSGGVTARDLVLSLFSGIGQGPLFIRSSTLPTCRSHYGHYSRQIDADGPSPFPFPYARRLSAKPPPQPRRYVRFC